MGGTIDPATERRLDPLLGWTSSDDMRSQARLQFGAKEAAVHCAEKHDIPYAVSNPKVRRPVVRKCGYAENFARSRRDALTRRLRDGSLVRCGVATPTREREACLLQLTPRSGRARNGD